MSKAHKKPNESMDDPSYAQAYEVDVAKNTKVRLLCNGRYIGALYLYVTPESVVILD